MDAILSLTLFDVIKGLLFFSCCRLLFRLSTDLLAIFFIMVVGMLLLMLLVMLPPIIILSSPTLLLMGIYYIYRRRPYAIHHLKQYAIDPLKIFIQKHAIEASQDLPRRFIDTNVQYRQLGMIWGTLLLVSLLTYQVLNKGFLTQWDLPVYYFMRTLRSPNLDGFFVQISLFNSSIMSCFWAIMSLYFILKKDSWRTLHWIALGILIGTMTIGLKYGTAMPRPGAIFHIKDSFPSAHVSSHMTLLGGLLMLFDIQHTFLISQKLFVYTLYGMWLGLMAFSRLYLAAHWLTDIIGGILISFISLKLLSLSYHRRIPAPPSRGQLALVSIGTLGTLWLIRFIVEYDKILSFYMASF